MRLDRSMMRTGVGIAAGAALGLLAPILPALGGESPPVSCESRFAVAPAAVSDARAFVGQVSLPVGFESHLVGVESRLVGVESRLVGVVSQVCSVVADLPGLTDFGVMLSGDPHDDFTVPPVDGPDDELPVPPIDVPAEEAPADDPSLADSFDLSSWFPDGVDLGFGDQLDQIAAALEAAAQSVPPQVTDESEPPQVSDESGPSQQETEPSEPSDSPPLPPLPGPQYGSQYGSQSQPALPTVPDFTWPSDVATWWELLAAWFPQADADSD